MLYNRGLTKLCALEATSNQSEPWCQQKAEKHYIVVVYIAKARGPGVRGRSLINKIMPCFYLFIGARDDMSPVISTKEPKSKTDPNKAYIRNRSRPRRLIGR